MSGVIVRHAELQCDVRDCAQRFETRGTVTQVRRVAISHGWTHAIRPRSDSGPAPTFDFCPSHRDQIDRLGVVEVHP